MAETTKINSMRQGSSEEDLSPSLSKVLNLEEPVAVDCRLHILGDHYLILRVHPDVMEDLLKDPESYRLIKGKKPEEEDWEPMVLHDMSFGTHSMSDMVAVLEGVMKVASRSDAEVKTSLRRSHSPDEVCMSVDSLKSDIGETMRQGSLSAIKVERPHRHKLSVTLNINTSGGDSIYKIHIKFNI